MRAFLCITIALLCLFGCSNESDFSEGNTSVVITKNPKGGSGGGTEPRVLQLSAPWLESSTNLLIEVREIVVVDAQGARDTVGVLDAGTFLTIGVTTPAKLQFEVETTKFSSALRLEVVTKQISAKNSRSSFFPYLTDQVLSLSLDTATTNNSNNVVAAYLSPASLNNSSTCKLSTQLSAKAQTTRADRRCGGTSSGSSSDDDSDNDPDDNDDSRD